MLRTIYKGAFVFATVAVTGSAFGFSNLYVFGDSLSDVGNDSFYTGGGTPGPGYYDGRFSNGPIWVDDIASSLGLGPLTPSALGGTDFAFGGATVTSVGTLVPSIAQQIGEFHAADTSFSATDLVAVWAGANDFLDGDLNAAGVASGLATDLNSLYALGARNIIVPNLPELADLPEVAGESQSVINAAEAFTQTFNSDLATDLTAASASDPGLKIYGIDFYSYVNGVMANPSAYGFSNVTGELIKQPAGTTGYLYWDGEHPTAAGHALLAGDVLQSVPEPPAYAALGFGLLALLRIRRRKTVA